MPPLLEESGGKPLFLTCSIFNSTLIGVVAGAVAYFEFFFAQIWVGDLDRDLSIGAVALFVRRRIRDEVLRSQFALDLRKRRVQIEILVGKERAARARLPPGAL